MRLGHARTALLLAAVVLAAFYMLWLVERIFFGPARFGDEREGLKKKIFDLTRREILVFAPLIVLIFWMGIYPAPFLKVMEGPVDHLLLRMGKTQDLAIQP